MDLLVPPSELQKQAYTLHSVVTNAFLIISISCNQMCLCWVLFKSQAGQFKRQTLADLPGTF